MYGLGISAGFQDPFRGQNYVHNNANMLVNFFIALTLAKMGKIAGALHM